MGMTEDTKMAVILLEMALFVMTMLIDIIQITGMAGSRVKDHATDVLQEPLKDMIWAIKTVAEQQDINLQEILFYGLQVKTIEEAGEKAQCADKIIVYGLT